MRRSGGGHETIRGRKKMKDKKFGPPRLGSGTVSHEVQWRDHLQWVSVAFSAQSSMAFTKIGRGAGKLAARARAVACNPDAECMINVRRM